ncbi:hypothetical protein SMICM304S_12254 [Streptomyces microflavus]
MVTVNEPVSSTKGTFATAASSTPSRTSSSPSSDAPPVSVRSRLYPEVVSPMTEPLPRDGDQSAMSSVAANPGAVLTLASSATSSGSRALCHTATSSMLPGK